MRRAGLFVQARIGQRDFQEADDHRQRRAQFVRRVGDEVAPHRLDAFRLGGVVRDEDLAPVLERDDLDDQLAAADRQRQRLFVAAEDQVVDEFRMPDQVRHAPALVGFQRQAQVLLGGRVAPFEEQHVVHDGHAFRQQMHGLAEARQPFRQLVLVAFVVAAQAVQAGEHVGPGAPPVWQLAALRVVQPFAQLVQVVQLDDQEAQRDEQRERQPGDGAEQPPGDAGHRERQAQAQQRRHPKHDSRIQTDDLSFTFYFSFSVSM